MAKEFVFLIKTTSMMDTCVYSMVNRSVVNSSVVNRTMVNRKYNSGRVMVWDYS